MRVAGAFTIGSRILAAFEFKADPEALFFPSHGNAKA